MANPLVALQSQMPNIVGNYQAGQRGTEELQTARLGRVMEQMKLDAAQRDQTQKNQLLQFYQQNGPGLVSGDPGAVNDLAKLDPSLAQGFQEKAQANKDAQIKRATDQAEFIGRGVDEVLNSKDDVERANKYNALVMQAKAAGIDVSRAPPQWGSEAQAYLTQAKARATSVKDQIAAQTKAADDAENKRRFGITSGETEKRDAEAARANRAREAQAAETANRPIALSPDATLVNPRTGIPLATGAVRPPKLSEDQAKNSQLYERSLEQAKILLGDPETGQGGTYDALAGTGNQLARGALGVVTAGFGNPNAVTSGEGQRAANALKDLAASYLYSVSGATANPGEVANLSDTLTPKLTDTKETLADKKARIRQMVDSIKLRAGPGAAQVGAAPGMGGGAPKQLPHVTTKAEFDALPPGTFYTENDGKQYRKP